MSKSSRSDPADLKYRRVEVSGLRKGRRGKHYALMQDILRELNVLPADSAMEIPLADMGIGLNNLRSAIHRAANVRGLKIGTLADAKNFYVWKSKSEG